MPKKKNTKNAGISLEQRYTNSTAKEASEFLGELSEKMKGEMATLTNIKGYIKDNLTKDVKDIYDMIGVTEPENKKKEKTEEEAKEDAKRQAKGYIEINKYIMEQCRKLQTAYKKSNICKFYNEKSFFEKFKGKAKDRPECHGDTFFENVQRDDELKKKYYNAIDLSAQKINEIYNGGDNKDWLEKLNNLDKNIHKDMVKKIKNKGVRKETEVKQYKTLPELYKTLAGLVGANVENEEKLNNLTKAWQEKKEATRESKKISRERKKQERKNKKKMSADELKKTDQKRIKDTEERSKYYQEQRQTWKAKLETNLLWLRNLKRNEEIKLGDKNEQNQDQNQNQNNGNKYKVGVVGDIKNYLLDERSVKTWEEYEKTHFEILYTYKDLKKHLITELNDILKDNKEFQLVRSTINSILTENNIYKFEKLLKFFNEHSNKLQLKTGGESINEKDIKLLDAGTKKDLQELRQVTKKKRWEISDMETFAKKLVCLEKIKGAIKPFEKHDGQNTFIQCTFTSNHYTPTPLLPEDSIDGKYSEKNIQMLRSGLNKAAYAIGNFAKNVKLPKQEIKIKFPMWDTGENKTFEIGKVCEIIKTMQEKYAAYMNLKKSAKELFNAITTAHKDKKSFVVANDNDGTKYNFDEGDKDETKVEKNEKTKKQLEKVTEVLNAYNAIQKPN